MISEKAKNITPFIVMEVLERASILEKEGKNIIHLEVGEPDFDVPSCVSKASEIAMKQGRHTILTVWAIRNCGWKSATVTLKTTESTFLRNRL